jgi:hypothetical protein
MGKTPRSGDGCAWDYSAQHSEPKAFRFKEVDMKRTRRIEITRYRRTVTVTVQGNEPAVEPVEEITVIDALANEWEALRRGDDLDGESIVKVIPPSDVRKLQRPSFSFRKWLRQRL